ncbi:tRNA dihydrouridine synthase DusB [Marinomonas mediterranea]|jgi:tRNA-U20-dihydrouridine synthase|uniref:tRNA-dihydrouridine synthase B n=1 Tax=Marinomonas mediterranea (strain ATCC 700492 / JCM 21426 / NBRC 103028 / MMB-1) TaxID=717774 RepID=F2K2D0_MARM1|nr:tRNA dihydrouridine synthase DusB [Marinomonas mediterranea]ADZ92310.1 TIM-barrel protein, nifR3 family [Marinomonas mediterranea MMB-1]WCN10262.1 tRNA dihydrouridine synthase DusB [Marinomonas mediterranea]WCN14309.1 tRNA dihydrouridine synthase DusB [Marinomonas mediterranea]WCN18361.1 tRNA dihydrouridine synthase DusB [Marinomonas mediterranea MMB-1]
MAFAIGSYNIDRPVILAPMAGVTDLPFRRLCYQQGAGLVVSEMVTSDVRLWNSTKSKHRLVHDKEIQPRSVQIAGANAEMMVEAAQKNVELGAQIIDINMGCPAKKVLNKAAGSALLKDESLVQDILKSVVDSVEVPVTLKIRTGWSSEQRNGLTIAKIAEDCGIQALAVHGRTRACKFQGEAEYDTIAEIKQSVGIPVFANGDITDAQTAQRVMTYTKADAVMIGRAAQGRPWIFNEINHYLRHGELPPSPDIESIKETVVEHVKALHQFYGEFMGIRIARKHVGWYLKTLADTSSFRSLFNKTDDANEQLDVLESFFVSRKSTSLHI